MGISVDIHKTLGDFTLDIAFHSDARRIGILGPSGCGKSMTLRSIAGIERPDRGRIALSAPAQPAAGRDAQNLAEADQPPGAANLTDEAGDVARGAALTTRLLYDSTRRVNLKPQKRNVGYMFQNYALFPTMTVIQNIAAGLRLPAEKRQARVREMIRRFHLEGLDQHYPGQLSGGQQQRVALARIMAYRPDLILLDEPFSALDQHLKERLQHELIEMLADYEGQVIMVSHSRDELYRFSEELIILDQGQILASGKTQDLFTDPGTVPVARMTGCKNFSAAKRLDAHHLQLTDWGIVLTLTQEIPEDTCAIGYRAHYFEPIWGPRQENCLAFRPSGWDELPFERRYYIYPERDSAAAGGVTPAADGAIAGSAAQETSGAIAGSAVPETGSTALQADGVPAGNTAPERSAAPDDKQGPVLSDDLICWFVQEADRRRLDQSPPPDWLRLREEAVLLLHGA